MESNETIDDLLDRFDEAWHGNRIPNIEEYLLPADDQRNGQLLAELVKIDLEYRWRTPSADRHEKGGANSLPWFPLLRDYQREYPSLGENECLPADLIAEEYRVRRRWGDQPSHASYAVRFGNDDQILAALREVDAELGDESASAVPPQSTPSLLSGSAAPADVPSSPRDLCVGDDIDDFRLLNWLGSGAFAEVFLAQQKSMQRLVALKVSTGENHEPQLLSNLDHPNIVRVFDERRVGPLSLLYMQYVAGGSLKEIVQRMEVDGSALSGELLADAIAAALDDKGQAPTYAQRNSPVRQLSWGMTVCWFAARLSEALGHAHEQGVLHRDIKPANILLSAEASPMLVDFNLSFGESIEGATAEDRFGGSLAYMSPQQLRVFTGESTPARMDTSSDFFSLSIVLWELLTGERPYSDETGHATQQERLKAMLQARRAWPDFADLPADCPGGLRKTLEECLTTTTAADLSPVDSIVRRLHLSLVPAVDRLLNPEPESWPATWAKWPTTWLLIFGLVPNVVLSLLNIWANGRLTVEAFDLELFRNTQQPVINAVNFSLGTLFGVWILVPVIKAMWAQRSGLFGRLPDWERIGHRCLLAPALLAALIFALWIESGISFPLWNQRSPASTITTGDFFVFFSSQVLHGLIAAATTYVFISLVTVLALFPRFLPEREDSTGERRLTLIDRQLSVANACLGLTPFFAVLMLGWSEQVDSQVFVALAVVGVLSYLITTTLTPRIRRAVHTLRFALSPTSKITRMDPAPAKQRGPLDQTIT